MNKALVMAILSSLLILGCTGKPEKLEDIGGGVIAINPSNFSAPANWMVIDIKSHGRVGGFALDSERIVKDIRQYFPSELDKYEKIWIFAQVDLVDKYGNKSTDRTFGIEWPTSELKKINYETSSFTMFDLLDLATDVRGFNRVGNEAFVEYCTENDNAKLSNRFCLLVASE